ncbi:MULTISPECIES: ABC transporter permease [Alphaproteobacteria]|uniref:Amino acid ABC transporter permease n=2 Tax=Alphaproteobacteria TaxID=28211 RepID=A0A512HCJ8_9HYPH|nr:MULTISPECIES: ABC transporter permease [Alphaproteobacteria]GEO83100.1 amino acid ABC transporter permease [Ciceribacter naphthalenivorans]GLR20504.1 amino acid ABC transporter permease [Ciceribacter naphthalenivorans]GLT03360.1 amino acid ABC transporter permease [Sphingomonas psychrolutea]
MSYATHLIPPRPAPPQQSTALNGTRILGLAGLMLWLLLGLALAYMMVSNWDTDKFIKYGPRYLSGLWVTMTLVITSITCGALLSVPIAFARMSKNRVLNILSYSYVYVFRGTPLLAQIYMIYYGLGSFRPQIEAIGLWWFFREAWYCALLSMTLNTAAYQAEILRGAIQSVSRGQTEGAKSLGLGPFITFRKIILPQALIVALRPYGNEIILMIKGSAIVAVVTVLDLMGQTRYTFSRTFDYQAYLWAAIFYLSIVEAMRHIWAAMEARLTRHLKR